MVSEGAEAPRKRMMTLTPKTRESLVQTLEGIIDLCTCILKDSTVQYILVGNLQSDALEGEFGIYRGMFGGLCHISFEQVFIAAKFRVLSLLQELEADMDGHKHSASCCDEEILDELDVIDNLHSKVENISLTERNALFYVAGYICKKESLFHSIPQKSR